MARQALQAQNRNDFRIAIICALPVEAGMVRIVLDEECDNDKAWFAKTRGDHNTYTLGVMGQHNVVLVHMPGMGAIDAATAAAGLQATFPSIEIAFIVGICGASPKNIATQQEICLGDCIVSTALVQYDFGRQYPGHFSRKTDLEDSLGRARPMIRSLLAKLQTSDTSKALERRLAQHLQLLQQKEPRAHYPGVSNDHLFESTYLHIHHDIDGICDKCVKESGVCIRDCSEIGCEEAQLIPRTRLTLNGGLEEERLPQLHFGRYGSANTVLKSGVDRDEYTKVDKIIAFEMEAAGIWESIPTLIVKSACDYADSHKSKEWQIYAAATAASGLKVILEQWEVSGRPSEKDKQYAVQYSLEGVPIAKKFVDRPNEMQKLEQALLPDDRGNCRRLFVLRGLGGIGKTQLAVRFMQQYQNRFTAIFWLDGSSEDSLKQGVARCASNFSAGQISDQSREYASTGEGDIDAVVTEVIDWLKISDNTRWLLVFDNIDRKYVASNPEPLSYDIKRYIPAVNHGSILITTRLGQLESLGESQEVKKVDSETAKAILDSWHDLSYSK